MGGEFEKEGGNGMMKRQNGSHWVRRVAPTMISAWFLVFAVSGTAQETNASNAASDLPIVEPTPSAPPARPPVNPEVEPRLRQLVEAMKNQAWDEANAGMRSLYEAFPDDPDVRRQYSLLLIQSNETDAALDMLEPLLGTVYADFVILNNAAWLYATSENRGKRDSTRAVDLAQEALLLMPMNYHIWSTLAEAHYANGQFDKARKASLESLRLAQRAKASRQETDEIASQARKIEKAIAALALIE